MSICVHFYALSLRLTFFFGPVRQPNWSLELSNESIKSNISWYRGNCVASLLTYGYARERFCGTYLLSAALMNASTLSDQFLQYIHNVWWTRSDRWTILPLISCTSATYEHIRNVNRFAYLHRVAFGLIALTPRHELKWFYRSWPSSGGAETE